VRALVGVSIIAFVVAGSCGNAAAQPYWGYPPPSYYSPSPPSYAYPPPPGYYPPPYAASRPWSYPSVPTRAYAPDSYSSTDDDRSYTDPAGAPPEPTIGGRLGAAQSEVGQVAELPPQLRRQLVYYPTSEPPGTVIVDTPNTYLYLVLGGGQAIRYGIGVGREGFTWSGTERISRKTEWPDWYPPKEMIARQPYLPRFVAGGQSNPLGARALYLGSTQYRIHGTNEASTIGHFVSSGCIRLTNEDIEDLYNRVNVGTRVVVLAGSPDSWASTQSRFAR
jgi:lipoprotein-anchoring transpeptidase ErfK/SrfK